MKRVPEGGPNDIRHSLNGDLKDNLSGDPMIGNLQAGTNGGVDIVIEAQVYLKDISARSCGLNPKNDSACHKNRACGKSMELSYARKCKSDIIPLMWQ